MKLELLAGAALVGLLAASGASAAPADYGWYGPIDLGAHGVQPLNVTTSNGDFARVHTNIDWVGFARVGYKVSPHVRIELEGGYRPAKINNSSFGGGLGH